MQFKPTSKNVDVTINAKDDVLIHVKESIPADEKADIFFDGTEYWYVSYNENKERTETRPITNTETLTSAKAVLANYSTLAVKDIIAKNEQIAATSEDNENLKKQATDTKIYALLGGTLLAAGAIGGAILAYDTGKNLGEKTGEKNILEKAVGWGAANYTAGATHADIVARDNLEAKILATADSRTVDAMEFKLFKKPIGDISTELTQDQELQLYAALVEQKALDNSDLSKVLTNSVLDLINVTYKVPKENLAAKNLSLLQAVQVYGELAANNVKVDNKYLLGKQHGAKDILNQTEIWNATHYQSGFVDGTDNGKILGSTELYQAMLDVVEGMLDQSQIDSTNGNATALLNLYKEAVEAYGYSLTKWNADYTIGVMNGGNVSAAEEGLERVASLGAGYSVAIDNDVAYASWYANLTQRDADELENVTGADVQQWYNHGYSFGMVDTIGDGAVLKMYTDNDVQMFKVSQDLYNGQKAWKNAYTKK